MSIKIRAAKPTEFEDVYHLIKEFAIFIKTPEKVKITPAQMVKDEKHFNCLVAVDGTTIVGFATYFFSYYSWTGRAIYLDDLYVREKFRNQGIGNQLFDKVIELGKSEDCYKMKWQVTNWNKKAQEFYKRKGAIIDEVEINCDLKLS